MERHFIVKRTACDGEYIVEWAEYTDGTHIVRIADGSYRQGPPPPEVKDDFRYILETAVAYNGGE